MNTTGGKKVGGRKIGQRNWSEEEFDDALDVIAEELPAGSEGWEKCAMKFLKVSSSKKRKWGRSATALRRMFDKLIALKAPTGDPYMPRIVQRARQIQEDMKAAEVSGEAPLNNDAVPIEGKGLAGTKLYDSSMAKMRSTTPKRGKVAALVESIEDLNEGNEKAATIVAQGMLDMAEKLVSSSVSADAASKEDVEELTKRVESVEKTLGGMTSQLGTIIEMLGDRSEPAAGGVDINDGSAAAAADSAAAPMPEANNTRSCGANKNKKRTGKKS